MLTAHTKATQRSHRHTAVDAGGAPVHGPPRERRWKVVLAVGLAAVAGYFAMPSATALSVTYLSIGVASVLCALVAIRSHRADERLGWYLLTAGYGCFVLGDGVYNFYDLVLHQAPPYPSVADAVYLAAYPLLLAGVLRISRRSGVPGSRESLADAAMLSVGALALSWQLLIGHYARDTTVTTFGRLVAVAYPIMDVALLFVVVTAVMTGAARRPTDKLIGLALLSTMVTDFAYGVLVLRGTYAPGNILDAGFLLAYVLIATAALHPSARDRPARLIQAPAGRRLWMPLVAGAGYVSPFILLISGIFGLTVDVPVIAGTSIALFTLATVRAYWLFGRLRRQTIELENRGKSLHVSLAAQQALETDLRHQAFHDSLTGLANRALLHERVAHALESSVRARGSVALLFCDLDGFKGVNDSLGHQVGDELLVIVSRRLNAIVRPGDTVARLGGDEFAILLEDAESLEVVTALADRTVAALHDPVTVNDQLLTLSVSIGIAIATAGTTTETLLSEADVAMYDAKAAGKNRFTIFQTVMRARIVDRMAICNAFDGSLQRGEFYCEYQPQLSLADGSVEGFEALVRWRHPALGPTGPDRFIPLADETGFIVPLGRWILQQACLEAASWTVGSLTVSVNVSGRQLQDPDFVRLVKQTLTSSGLAAGRLVLEITESVLVLEAAYVATVLSALRRLGVRIAIDDFGTGYSSLRYLQQFPVDILKIDKSFIDPLVDPSSDGAAFVRTLLRLAEDLHLDVTAEGIEQQVQRDVLNSLHCHSGQGFLMSRPLGADAISDYIADMMPDPIDGPSLSLPSGAS